jgi:DNA-binding LacI/PurR family transcriptional regulator
VSEDVSVERLSVAEAAEAMGVTRDAIHKRITRGTIEHEKGEDGRFYVYVDTSTEGSDTSTDMSVDKSKVEALERLIDSQHDRIAFLERELDRRGDETTRLHQIVAGLTQANAQLAAHVPELEAPPQEAADSAETVEEAPDRAEPHSATAQEGARRPWWRRVIGR